jgi:hypothetical protein
MRFKLTFSLLALILTACAPSAPPPTLEPTATKPGFTPIPTLTITPQPTATPTLPVHTTEPENVVLDFVARACEAQWSNNSYELPCPGDPLNNARGFIFPTNYAAIEGGRTIDVPLLIGLPGQRDGNGSGLFGRYPAMDVLPGDTFYTLAACQGDAQCQVDFALEYFDAAGNFRSDKNWRASHQVGDGPFEIQFDLSSLSGQRVEFTLVLREQGPAQEARVVWINPHIARTPDALSDLQTLPESPTVVAQDQTPGVINGWVDMSTAPPYLNDPVAGSSPVVVTFFNLDDGTYWYIQTSLTGHPNYQMTLPPGNYQVVAYGQGVGDEPYMTAGYTGENPSCDRNLKTITVGPSARVDDIVIADWNWTCNGNAKRPAKPADVPVP